MRCQKERVRIVMGSFEMTTLTREVTELLDDLGHEIEVQQGSQEVVLCVSTLSDAHAENLQKRCMDIPSANAVKIVRDLR